MLFVQKLLISPQQRFLHAGVRKYRNAASIFRQAANATHSLATSIHGDYFLRDCTGDDLQRQRHERRLSTKISMFIATLKACSSSGELERGRRTHTEVLESGLISNIVLANTVIDMYAKCGSMIDAQRAFDGMKTWDVVSWTSLINGYVTNNEPEIGLNQFSLLQSSGCRPDSSSYIAALKACTALAVKERGRSVEGKLIKLGALNRGLALHAQAERDGCMELFLASSLVTMYGKCGSLSDAGRVFQRMPVHDAVSCTAFVAAAGENGNEALALETFSGMRFPSAKSVLAALRACSRLAEREEPGQLVEGRVMKPGALERVVAIHSRARLTGLDSNTFVANSLVDLYSKCGSLENSRSVFTGIENKNRTVVSWNSLILGYAENGSEELALEAFSEMRLRGFQPNSLTYSATLKACASLVALKTGKLLYGEACRFGLENELGFDSCVVDFHGRCGSIAGAQQVFDSLTTARDPVSWTALLAGYSRQGDCSKMFTMFHRMLEEGLKPDGVTFLCLLTACGRAGLICKGEACFQAMGSRFGVSPGIDHFHCMIDMLCRENRVDEALSLVRSMAHEPNAVTWRTMLSGCKKWKNVVIGRLAFEALLRLDDRDSAGYLLMLNLYGSLGMWEDQREIERLRTGTTERNRAGRSWWTDEVGVLHSFTGSNRPECEGFDEKLEQVMERVRELRQEGGLVGVDDGRMGFVCGHSERIALVYALVKTPPGMSLRLRKNLRVCDDCHLFLAVVSRFEQREIVCRDMSRLHIFRNGFCCCGDYW